MDGLQLGERKVRVSMAKPSSLEKYYEKVGQKDNRPPAAIALQVSHLGRSKISESRGQKRPRASKLAREPYGSKQICRYQTPSEIVIVAMTEILLVFRCSFWRAGHGMEIHMHR